MIPNINNFIRVAREQKTGNGTTDFAKQYIRANKTEILGLKVEISFGVGRASAIPWIAFVGFNQSVRNGIYPVYLFYKEYDILVLAYGISESNKPSINWKKAKVTKTISEYFWDNLKIKPNRYGSSFVYKVYQVNSLPSESELHKDLKSLIKIYAAEFKDNSVFKEMAFLTSNFIFKLSEVGLMYNESIVKRFTASLLTKPFGILTGLSGSGKTKLAQAFVQWICANENQYKIIPVGADWTNREPLLGYPNGLDDEKYVTPDSGALDLIIQAQSQSDIPHFLILDEMNLSHVERYFADFLSVMESEDKIKLYSGADRKDSNGNIIPKEIGWPANLFIIGTVNIDETTYMFSPKVLDRANVIEFRISADDMKDFLGSNSTLNMKALFVDEKKEKGGLGQNMAADFMVKAKDKNASHGIDVVVLHQFFIELQNVGAEFGYRSASEIEVLLTKLAEGIENVDSRLDIAIMQKLLPKLHGSRKKLSGPLETLAGFCLKEDAYDVKGREAYKKLLDDELSPEEKKNKIRFPLSFEKVERMYKNAIENGFTSYAEA